jgi:hypothetical protein
VESSVGSGAFSGVTMIGISVQLRATASQPCALSSSVARKKAARAASLKSPLQSSSKMIRLADEEIAAGGGEALRRGAQVRVDLGQIARLPPRDGRPHRQQRHSDLGMLVIPNHPRALAHHLQITKRRPVSGMREDADVEHGA